MLTAGGERGAERKEAASRLPLQMIKKVAPHAVNKQTGLRKAGVSPSCKTGMTPPGCHFSG